MTVTLFVYLAGLVNHLSYFLLMLSASLAFFSLPHTVIALEGASADKRVVRALSASVFVFFLRVFIPSEKTMYLMAGTYAAERVAQSPEGQEIGDKVLAVITGKLDDLVREKK